MRLFWVIISQNYVLVHRWITKEMGKSETTEIKD